MPEADLRDLLLTHGPAARDDLRRVLIRDQADRDAIASQLMRYRDENGQGCADIIDLLTMYRMLDGEWCGCSGRWTLTVSIDSPQIRPKCPGAGTFRKSVSTGR